MPDHLGSRRRSRAAARKRGPLPTYAPPPAMNLQHHLDTLMGFVGTFPTLEQVGLLSSAVEALNGASPTDIAEAVVVVAAKHPKPSVGMGNVIRALLAAPTRSHRGEPLLQLRPEVLLAAVAATPWRGSPFSSFGLLPLGLTPIWAASAVVERVGLSIEEIRGAPDPVLRLEGWLALLERLETTFEKKGTADLEVVGDDDVRRPLGALLRRPFGAVVHALIDDAERTPTADRRAVFARAWAVMRAGWCESLRRGGVDESALLALLANTRELAQGCSEHVEAEPASVRDGVGARRLRFELARRAGLPDVMRACLSSTATWAEHAAVVAAYGERTTDAIAYLSSLSTSAERDRALLALLSASGSTEEALSLEIILPAKLEALEAKHRVTRERLVELGLEKLRRGDEGVWLEYLLQHGDFVRAKKIATRCHPQLIVRALDRPIPQAPKAELLGKAIDGLFAAKTAYRDREEAERVVRDVLAAAAAEPAAKKLLAQARKKASKALDGADHFLRELAGTIERELDVLERTP